MSTALCRLCNALLKIQTRFNDRVQNGYIIKVCPNRNYTQSISFSPPFTNNNNNHINFINKTKPDI